MIASRSFWGISPCIDETVKSAARIFSVNQSTCTIYSGTWEHKVTQKANLAPGVAEDDGLCDGEGIVKVA